MLKTMRWAVAVLLMFLLASWADVAAATKGKRPHPKRKRRAHKSQVVFHPDYASAPSYRYGQLDREACHAELTKRAVDFSAVDEARGVLAPVRIPSGVRGVLFRTELSRSAAASSPWEVFDCRLVLALHDFAGILVAHHIDEVVIYSAWRPPSKSWPEGKLARRHPGALAVDMFKFRQKQDDGSERWLDVKDDFGGRVGAKTCGDGALEASGDAAKELRALVCEASEKRLFTSQLTPHYDRAHFNHFHFEITPEVTWQLLK